MMDAFISIRGSLTDRFDSDLGRFTDRLTVQTRLLYPQVLLY